MVLDREKAQKWLDVGAQPSDAVRRMLDREPEPQPTPVPVSVTAEASSEEAEEESTEESES